MRQAQDYGSGWGSGSRSRDPHRHKDVVSIETFSAIKEEEPRNESGNRAIELKSSSCTGFHGASVTYIG